MYKIILYRDRRGKVPVENFVLGLAPKTRLKILSMMELLEQEGPRLPRPYADKVRDKIYELRIRFASDQVRIFYFFVREHRIVFVHAIRKKTSALPVGEIEIAGARMKDYLSRFEGGVK